MLSDIISYHFFNYLLVKKVLYVTDILSNICKLVNKCLVYWKKIVITVRRITDIILTY